MDPNEAHIIHAAQDRAVADAVRLALERRNYDCDLLDASKARVVLLVYSDRTNGDESVALQVEDIDHDHQHFCVLRLSGAEPAGALVPAFARLGKRSDCILDAREPPWQRHLKDLDSILPPTSAQDTTPTVEGMPTKVFVGNLRFDTMERDVADVLAGHGDVRDVRLIMDRDTGRSRGFAFVEMGSRAEAQAAIDALDGQEVGGRQWKLDLVKNRGGGGGRGGGARRGAADVAANGGDRRGVAANGGSSDDTREASEAHEEAAPDEARAKPRHLQARVETPGRGPRPVECLEVDTNYVACVFIGARRAGFHGLGTPLDEPPPNPDGSPIPLRVVFWEPTVCPEPKVAPLDLWPQGDTNPCRFSFRTSATAGPFEARITIFHQNRALQTGLLKGEIGVEGLTFVPDAAPHPSLAGVEDRLAIGASIIVDAGASGARACVFADGKARVVEIGKGPDVAALAQPVPVRADQKDGLRQLVKVIGHQISKITDYPDDYDSLGKEGTRRLLVDLAQHGALLREQLPKEMGDKLDAAPYVQVVGADAHTFLPVEFFYAGVIPEDDARICDGAADAKAARQALASNECCGAYTKDPEHVVCPRRFWSLNKVIERHARVTDSGDFELQSQPPSTRHGTLDPLTGLVLAASERVYEESADSVTELRGKLDVLAAGPDVEVAKSWDEWADSIERVKPHMLVLLPHHDVENGANVLEISGKTRKSLLIRKEHVRPKDQEISPVVLLIGCGTRTARIDFENFVTMFKRRGASIVVSTIGSILAEQAPPAAEAIVEELAAACERGGETFGDVMLAVRRRLVREGMPMVLGLTSYGDADWRLAHAPPERIADDADQP